MTLLLGFAAVNTGNNLLYLLVSALLGFMAVSGWLGQQNLRNLELKLVLPREVFAGQPTLVGIRLHNQRRRLPAFLIRVNLGNSPPLFAHVAPALGAEVPLTLVWPDRGQQQIDNLWLSSCFPINFFVRSLKVPVAQQLIVFPAPLPATPPQAGDHNRQRHQQATTIRGDSGDLRSIQDYQGGEPLKAIHWKLSARHDRFKVKQHEGLGSQPLLIDLSQPGPNIERRLSQATGLIVEQLRLQRPVGLKLANRHIPPQVGFGQRQRLLTELALYNGR